MTTAGTSRLRWLVGLLLAIVVTRIPLILSCYSSDGDAWRVAHVGKTFWQTGEYSASRLPGYPVHEILSGPFVLLGGSPLSNCATLIVSLVLIVVWYEFVEKHASSPKLITLLLAFTPLFWMDSATTLDYVWSLLFILLSLSAAQQKKAIIAGLWLGCAIGSRPANAVAIAPLIAMLYLRSSSNRDLVAFTFAAFCSSLAAFSPVLITYGLTGWIERTLSETSDAHLPFVQRVLSFLYRSVYSLGPLAVIGIGIVLATGRHKLALLIREREPIVIASIIGVFVFTLLFAFFPLDRSYLLPAFPFLYLVADRLASRRALVAVTCCVVSFAFINPDVVQHARPVGSPGFNLHAGIVIEEWLRRNQMMVERDQIGRLAITGKAVVMVGTSAGFWFENEHVEIDTLEKWKGFNDVFVHSKRNSDLHFIAGLPLNAVRSLQAEGYTLYCLDWTRDLLRKWNGYDPVDEGVKTITR
jgi:hypothetical protein